MLINFLVFSTTKKNINLENNFHHPFYTWIVDKDKRKKTVYLRLVNLIQKFMAFKVIYFLQLCIFFLFKLYSFMCSHLLLIGFSPCIHVLSFSHTHARTHARTHNNLTVSSFLLFLVLLSCQSYLFDLLILGRQNFAFRKLKAHWLSWINIHGPSVFVCGVNVIFVLFVVRLILIWYHLFLYSRVL